MIITFVTLILLNWHYEWLRKSDISNDLDLFMLTFLTVLLFPLFILSALFTLIYEKCFKPLITRCFPE